MKKDIYLSVVIPAYNEAKRIETTLLSLKKYFKDKDYIYEIIIVNDGSSDNTSAVVLKFKKYFKDLILIENRKNRGKGYSVKRGMLAAKGEYKLFMDADNSVKIDNLDIFLPYCENGNDVVIGSIKIKGSRFKEGNGWHRRLLGNWSKILIRFLAVPGIYDTQRGFKLFSKRAANKVFKKQTIDRFGFDIELLTIARLFGFKIKELPVEWDNPSGSKVTFLSYFESLAELFKIKKNVLLGVYYAKKKNLLRRELFKIKEFKQNFLLLFFLVLVTGLVLYKIVFIANTTLASSFWTIYGIITTIFLISRMPYAYMYNDEHHTIYSDSAYPDVSIIIAAKNEEKGIFKTIATCVNSRYPGKIECIVIDDGSTDGTKNEILRATEFFGKKVRLISFAENKGKREAMAVGINEALHEIIIFVDSDSFLTPDAVRHITEHFLINNRVGAVSGNTKVENANVNLLTRMQSIQYAVSFGVYKASESVHHSVTCCPGYFSAYRREAVKPLAHAWKEQKFLGTKGTFGDDRGLTNFVLQGWDIIYCTKAKATTMVPERFSVYWNQQLRWKKSWIREGIFAGTFMWKKRHPLASSAFYINFSFPIVGPILAGSVLLKSITTHNPLLAVIFMFGFMLLGIVFAFFARVYLEAENWVYMPLVSFLFVTVFMWQMIYALLTLRKTHWGTR